MDAKTERTTIASKSSVVDFSTREQKKASGRHMSHNFKPMTEDEINRSFSVSKIEAPKSLTNRIIEAEQSEAKTHVQRKDISVNSDSDQIRFLMADGMREIGEGVALLITEKEGSADKINQGVALLKLAMESVPSERKAELSKAGGAMATLATPLVGAFGVEEQDTELVKIAFGLVNLHKKQNQQRQQTVDLSSRQNSKQTASPLLDVLGGFLTNIFG